MNKSIRLDFKEFQKYSKNHKKRSKFLLTLMYISTFILFFNLIVFNKMIVICSFISLGVFLLAYAIDNIIFIGKEILFLRYKSVIRNSVHEYFKYRSSLIESEVYNYEQGDRSISFDDLINRFNIHIDQISEFTRNMDMDTEEEYYFVKSIYDSIYEVNKEK